MDTIELMNGSLQEHTVIIEALTSTALAVHYMRTTWPEEHHEMCCTASVFEIARYANSS
jgi:hypothetical protein